MEAFDHFDANRSGYLDYLELQTALHGYGFDTTVDECAELVREHDTDGDGKLSPHEFHSLLLDVWRRDTNAYASDVPPELQEAFDHFDANRSSYLDYLELQAALRGFGFDATLDESAELVRQFDDTSIGKLDLYSFAALIRHVCAQPVAMPRTPVAPTLMPMRLPSAAAAPARHLPPAHHLPPYGYGVADEAAWDAPPTWVHPTHYARPLLPSSVRAVFERCDDEGRGFLDAGRARNGLLLLGAQISLGETLALVRRFGSYLPSHIEAVVSYAQFVAVVEHVRGAHRRFPPTRPYARYSTYSHGVPGAFEADATRQPIAWYGHTPRTPF